MAQIVRQLFQARRHLLSTEGHDAVSVPPTGEKHANGKRGHSMNESKRIPVRSILNPGDKGTLDLVTKYGESLYKVRYRYDRPNNLLIKTAEIIVQKSPIKKKTPRPDADSIVLLKVKKEETLLIAALKKEKAWWNYRALAWELPYHKAAALGLTNRIVKESRKSLPPVANKA